MIVNIKSMLYPDEKSATIAAEDCYREFHPAGYGTHLDVKKVEGGWRYVGFRWDSCE